MRYAALVLAVLVLSGCAVYEDEAERSYTRDTLGIQKVFTTADVRIITEREHPVTGKPVVCTEPSPDVAKAVSGNFLASFVVNGGTGQAGGNGSLSGATAEAVAELAGRTTALLGLRDGLYRACEAYANGAIGANAYALIIGRYSQLMTTLFLGQDISGAVAAANKASSPPESQNTPPSGSGNGSPTGSGSPNGAPSQNASAQPTVSQAAPPTATPATGAAAALVRMNEDYLNLDYNTLHSLAVVCLNVADPTSLANVAADRAKYGMHTLCTHLGQLVDVNDLSKIATMATGLVKTGVLASPVNPMVATPTPAAPKTSAAPGAKTAPASPGAKNAAPVCTAVTTATKTDIIQVLQSQKYLTPTDNNYAPALNKFETDYGLGETSCATNQVGQKTLTVIEALAALAKKKP